MTAREKTTTGTQCILNTVSHSNNTSHIDNTHSNEEKFTIISLSKKLCITKEE